MRGRRPTFGRRRCKRGTSTCRAESFPRIGGGSAGPLWFVGRLVGRRRGGGSALGNQRIHTLDQVALSWCKGPQKFPKLHIKCACERFDACKDRRGRFAGRSRIATIRVEVKTDCCLANARSLCKLLLGYVLLRHEVSEVGGQGLGDGWAGHRATVCRWCSNGLLAEIAMCCYPVGYEHITRHRSSRPAHR